MLNIAATAGKQVDRLFVTDRSCLYSSKPFNKRIFYVSTTVNARLFIFSQSLLTPTFYIFHCISFSRQISLYQFVVYNMLIPWIAKTTRETDKNYWNLNELIYLQEKPILLACHFDTLLLWHGMLLLNVFPQKLKARVCQLLIVCQLEFVSFCLPCEEAERRAL